MYTLNKIYLIEVEDELKLFITSRNNVEKLHKNVYGENVNILWELPITNFTKNLLNLKMITSTGFYQSLESINIDEMKNTLIDLNNSLSNFCDMFKDEINTSETVLKKNVIPSIEKIYISTRKGSSCKNLELEKKENQKNFFQKESQKDMEEPKGIIEGESIYGGTSDYSFINGYQLSNDSIEIKKEAFIYYNTYFNKVVTLMKQLSDEELTEMFKELTYVSNVEGKEEDIENLKTALEKNYFFNIDQLDGFIKFYKADKKITEKQIQSCLETNFKFNNNVENRIKFTDLFNKLIFMLNIDHDNDAQKVVKQMLPRVLKSMKLNKKRYSDGNYWYGIKLKDLYDPFKLIENSTDMGKLLEDKINERDNLSLTKPTIEERLEFTEDKMTNLDTITNLDKIKNVEITNLDNIKNVKIPNLDISPFKLLKAGRRVNDEPDNKSRLSKDFLIKDNDNEEKEFELNKEDLTKEDLTKEDLTKEEEKPNVPFEILQQIGQNIFSTFTQEQKTQLNNIMTNFMTPNTHSQIDSPMPSFEMINDEDGTE